MLFYVSKASSMPFPFSEISHKILFDFISSSKYFYQPPDPAATGNLVTTVMHSKYDTVMLSSHIQWNISQSLKVIK